MQNQITFDIREVPWWLKDSGYYEPFVTEGCDDDTEDYFITIDVNHYIDCVAITNHDEFWRMISTMKFWCVNSIPRFLLDYAYQNEFDPLDDHRLQMLEEFEYGFDILQIMCLKTEEDMLIFALETQNLVLLDYAVELFAALDDDDSDDDCRWNNIWKMFHFDFTTIHALAVYGTPSFFRELINRSRDQIILEGIITECIVVGNYPLASECIAMVDNDSGVYFLQHFKKAVETGPKACRQFAIDFEYSWDNKSMKEKEEQEEKEERAEVYEDRFTKTRQLYREKARANPNNQENKIPQVVF